jgi:hypothetical protein
MRGDRKGRPESGQVLYTWGLNDRRQLGAVSCRKDKAKYLFECTADGKNRLNPSPVAALNYTQIKRIAMNRDSTFTQGLVAPETLQSLKPCTGACQEANSQAAASTSIENARSTVGGSGMAGQDDAWAWKWLSWGEGKRIGR